MDLQAKIGLFLNKEQYVTITTNLKTKIVIETDYN